MGKYTKEVKGWLQRSNRSIELSQKLLEAQYFPESIVKSYYAMFYASKALLVKDGIIKVTKHSGIISVLGKEYAEKGKLDPIFHRMLIEAFDLRQKSDYELYWESGREKAEEVLQNARRFVGEIKNLLSKTVE